ncbi:protein kinase [Frankia sp. AgPm24]|uniref:WD40 repeat domain-containing serine/threonine protein kinase n=1 Tax=Frankia sp. AgPm24 TaxID=631128 RepID=UPI00200CC2A0|nr:serine/threonine-protein kinase [Frankia sp. AgPm24]MCK9921504.1 protein kinase [Frankia sp. AgPm24]
MIVDRDRVERALPGYEVGDRLGSGQFGLVLSGQHRQIGRPVAIKVMEADRAEAVRLEFAAEARALGRLDHPHIVRVHDYVEAEGLCLVVMELLAGGTLAHSRAGLTAPEIAAVGLAVAAALQHAHTRGVLHRDIKTDNIMFAADGAVKVTDFGIAKIFEGVAATASSVSGTPMYMAPEQIRRGRIGPATDQYALGVLLYHLLTGRPPFDPLQSVEALWEQHLHDPPPPLTGVPTPIAGVVLRALAKDPTRRHRDADTFARALARAATLSHGPGWTDRVRLVLHLSPGIRAALQDASPAPAQAPVTSGHASTSTAAPPTPRALPAVPVARPGAPTDASPDASTLPPATLPPATLPPATPPPVDPRRPSRQHRRAGRGAGERARTAAVLGVLGVAVLAVLAGVVLLGGQGSTAGGAGPPPVTVPSPNPGHDPARAADWSKARPLLTLPARADTATSVMFRPDGSVVTGAEDGEARLWNISDPAHPATIGELPRDGSPVRALAGSRDGQLLATAAQLPASHIARLWNIADPTRPQALPVPFDQQASGILSVAFSPTRPLVATGGTDRSVWLWDVSDPANPQRLSAFPGADSGVWALAFSPDGRMLASGARDGSSWLWDVTQPNDPRRLATLCTSGGPIRSLAFAPNGRTLASASDDGLVRLCVIADPTHPTLGATFTGHTGAVRTVAFSPDGRILASASNTFRDRDIRLWDVNGSGGRQPVAVLSGHTAGVWSVAFSPDGHTLASASEDHTIRFWRSG